MSVYGEPRKPGLGKPTRSDRTAKERQAEEADERARRRFLIAQVAGEHPGTQQEKRAYIAFAMKTGLIPVGSVPAPSSLTAMKRRWEKEKTATEYIDKRRGGRPRKALAPSLEAMVRDAIERGVAVNVSELHKNVRDVAKAQDLPQPSYDAIHRRIVEAGVAVRSGSRYGARAAELDGFPHGSVVAKYAHDVWALDEFDLPLYLRIWSKMKNSWVSALLSVVLIIEVCTGAVIGYHVCNPTRRTSEDGKEVNGGFDSDDVLATILSAAFAALGSDATYEFAGYLPTCLRWDNAKPHKKLEAMLKEAGVRVKYSRKRRPADNGAAEARVKMAKQLLSGVKGHVDMYLPTDQVTQPEINLSRARATMAGYTQEGLPRVLPIHPEQLLSIEEILPILEAAVRRYNTTRKIARLKTTPAHAYQQKKRPGRERNVEKLVSELPVNSVTVTGDGIEHVSEGNRQRYLPMWGGKLVLRDQLVTYHPDPLSRCIWVRDENKRVLLLPQVEPDEKLGKTLALSTSAAARMISDAADIRSQNHLKAEIGAEGVQKANEAYAVAVEELKMAGRGQEKPPVAEAGAPGDEAQAADGDEFLNLFGSSDPADYLKSNIEEE
jgi:transposase InsO family protein